MRNNGSHSRDKFKEQVDPQATAKTSKLTQQQQSDALRNQRQSSINKSQQNLIKKDSYDKNAPPVPLPPKQKVREEDLMTQSKIMEARNGLQLLKKKMSQRGMSRGRENDQTEQPEREEIKPKNNFPPPGRKSSRQQDDQPEVPSQKALRKPPSDKPKPPLQKQQPPPPPVQEYINPNEQIRIQPKNVDFERMIEQQLRREMKGASKPIQKYQQPREYDDDTGELVQCSEGCGRKFKEDVLEKHEKICRKVFQQKRKVFDSANHRKVEAEGEIPQYSQKPMKKQQSKTPAVQAPSKQPQKAPQPQGDIPKWKLQSAAFRAGIKRAANRPLSKEQMEVQNQQKNVRYRLTKLLTLCNFCGRRFNKNAAQRHIPFCEEKSKKTPSGSRSMNSTFQGKKKK